MALSKSISVKNSGVFATYWRITGIDTCFVSNQTRVTVSGYLSQEAREEGKLPLMKHIFVWPIGQTVCKEDFENGDVLTKCYAKMKLPAERFMPVNPLIGAEDA